MKRISTLLLLSMMVAVISALPQTKLPVLQPSSAITELSVPSSQQEKVVQFLSQDINKRLARPSQAKALPAKLLPWKQHAVKSAQRATADTIYLNANGFLVGPEYEAETSEWYIALEAQGYTFRLCWFGPANTYCGSFSFDDISWDYTWGWFQSADLFYEIYPTDINMTISERKVGNYLSQIVLDAVIEADETIYVLHAEHDMYIPKSTIESVIDNAQLSVGNGNFVIDGNNSNLDLLLTVNSSTIDGVYTKEHFDSNATKVVYNGVEQQILQANLMVAGGYLDNNALGYLAEFSFYNQDTILHTVSVAAPLPPVKDTIHVSCVNLEVDESAAAYNMIMISGSSNLYDILAFYEATYAEAGVYDVSVMISDMITWETVQSISAKLTLTEDADGWHANIEAYGNDYNWYSIDMSYVVPEPTDTVKISFEEPAIATFRPDQFNMIQLLHENTSADYDASLTIYSIGLGEEFGKDNVLMDYSGIYDKLAQRSVLMADVKGVLNQRGDTTVINVSVIGWDAEQYDIELWYAVPEPVRTVELEMPVEFINRMQDGYYTLGAYTPDSTWYVSFSPMTSEVAGTFVNDGVFGRFGDTEGKYDFYGGETFIYEEANLGRYSVEKGTLIVEMTPDGKITAEAKVICSNAIYYHIKMTSEYNTHLDFDEPDMDVDRVYTTEDYVDIENQVEKNGYIYLSITAGDKSDMAAFFFYTEEVDEDIIIPVGVYPINYTEEYGTVQANPGVQGNGALPSFYAKTWEDGSLEVPLWLLVSGTVEITKDDDGNPHMEVNAFNSYGVPVHIVYDGTPTTFKNVTTKDVVIKKQLRDNQLLIIRNNEVYNVMGAQVD